MVGISFNGITKWSRTVDVKKGLYPQRILQSSDGGSALLAVLPSTGNLFIDNDILLVQTDSLGNPVVTRIYGSLENDGAADFTKATSGGYVMVGVLGDVRGRDNDMWLVKTDEDLLFDTQAPEIVLAPYNSLVLNSSTKIPLKVVDESEIRRVFYSWDGKCNSTLVSPYNVPILPQEGSHLLKAFAEDIGALKN